MQLELAFDDRTERLAEIHTRLLQHFASPGPFLYLDPLSQLVLGLIGGRTHGEVTKAAFVALFDRFGCWKRLRDASIPEIHEMLAGVTFADAKARHLKEMLEAITDERGELALVDLAQLPVSDALAWLERLPGVGRKVAAATLNLSTLRRRVLVIDTHHLRVMQRLGLVAERCSFAKAHDRITPVLPSHWTAADLDDHHHLMKSLGQTICRHDATGCDRCPLQRLCPTASAGLL